MFKVGDNVVVINSDWGIPVGTVLTVTEVDWDGVTTTTSEGSSVIDPYWYFNEVVLEEIYNSPLYQALRETDEET